MSEEVLKYWGFIDGGGDTLTTKWIGVSSLIYPVSIIALYLIFVATARKTELSIKLNYRLFSLPYNLFQVSLSAYIAKEVIISSSNYNLLCEPLHSTSTENGRRMAEAVWYFHMIKYIDIMDTVLIILKGNKRQLTFLHVFHHSSMILLTWMTIRHIPTGHCFIFVSLNSLVHTVMYSYFFLSCLGDWIKPYLWWKKYLTRFQIGQFFIIELHAMSAIVTDCPYPRGEIYLAIGYNVILIILFANFYLKSYNKKKAQ